MPSDLIPDLIDQVSQDRLRRDLFYLSSDPLPYRKLNFTRPGQSKNSLYEADDFIQAEIEACGYEVTREGVEVQAFRCDEYKPKAHQYSMPEPEDPWYTAYNLYAERTGTVDSDRIVLLLAHKDSQSWVDSPGAYDNGAGTVALLEIARVLSVHDPDYTIRFLFCNEEHRPWTSVTAAENARSRGDNLIAVFNVDSIGGKAQEDIDAGVKTNTTAFTELHGEPFADLMAETNEKYALGLRQQKIQRDRPGDDDGSFVNAGYLSAIINLGSFPYADPMYHTEEDRPERVDFENVSLATKLTLAAAIHVSLRT